MRVRHPVIPGRRESGEPGIQIQSQSASGFRVRARCARPGMTSNIHDNIHAPSLRFCPPPAASRPAGAGARALRKTACQKASSICATWRRTIAQDIRYATPNNFTGAALPGYAAGECVLRREAALALAQVAKDLAPQHLGLKVYDCYRPARAVAAMWRWAHDARGDGDKRFYPNVDKRELFSLGYIAAHSRHSAGIAVDLTLTPRPAPRPVMDRPSPGGDCTAAAAQRASTLPSTWAPASTASTPRAPRARPLSPRRSAARASAARRHERAWLSAIISANGGITSSPAAGGAHFDFRFARVNDSRARTQRSVSEASRAL